MQILKSADSHSQLKDNAEHGFTLLELLIVLTIFALMVGIASFSLSRQLPHMAVERATDMLVADLQQAKLTARLQGTPVTIEFSSEGYRIVGLERKRNWSRGILAAWDTETVHTVYPRVTDASWEIAIQKDQAASSVSST